MFQSSPALKDRCNEAVARLHKLHKEFQSSPALKDRCNAGYPVNRSSYWEVSILTGLERPVQQDGRERMPRMARFNPHRP